MRTSIRHGISRSRRTFVLYNCFVLCESTCSLSQIKGQQDNIKNSILDDGGQELTKQFSAAEDFIIQTVQMRKQAGSAKCVCARVDCCYAVAFMQGGSHNRSLHCTVNCSRNSKLKVLYDKFTLYCLGLLE